MLTALCTCLLIAVPLSLFCWHQWAHRHTLRLARTLPPVPSPSQKAGAGGDGSLLGFLKLVLGRWSTGYTGVVNLFVKIIKRSGCYGESRIRCVWFGIHPVLCFFDPEDIQTILNSKSTIEKGPEVNMLTFAFGKGLVTARGNYWKLLRRHVNPLFHSSNLSQLMPVLNQCGRDLASNLSQHVGTGHVDVRHNVNEVVLVSTCNLIFGPEFKVNVESEPFRKISKAIDNISSVFITRILKFWLWPEFMFKMLYYNLVQDIEMSISTFSQAPLEEFELRLRSQSNVKKVTDKSNGKENLKEGSVDESSRPTLIDIYEKLNQSYGGITKHNLQEEIVTFMLASSESTTITISSCLLALSLHPDIQERLFAEITSVVCNMDAEVCLQDLQNMPYLDQVIKETLRWKIIIPFVSKRVDKDIKLSSLTVPAGTTVGVSLSAVHYDPRHYPNPDRFNPDNFLPERVAARPKYTFVPFSGGPRVCIGSNYALMTAKTLIVNVVRKFKLSSDVEIDRLNYVPGLMFAYKEGYQVKLQQR